jgi:quinol monooxygenase YgiN
VLLIVGTVRLPADKLDEARPIMARMLEASRAEPGCLEYANAEDVIDRGLIHVKERWSGQAALSDHFNSPHIAAWRKAWPALGIRDRDLSLYEVGDPRPT